MTYQVEMSAMASREVRQTYRWKAEKDRRAAGRWQAALLAAIHSLEDQPERFSLAPEAEWCHRPIRQMLFGKRSGVYRVLYHVRGDVVFIARVRHSAQDFLSSDDLEATADE